MKLTLIALFRISFVFVSPLSSASTHLLITHHWSVPENGIGAMDDLDKLRDSLRANIETHQIVRDASRVGRMTNLEKERKEASN